VFGRLVSYNACMCAFYCTIKVLFRAIVFERKCIRERESTALFIA